MAKYTIRLVDHATWSTHDQFGIQKHVQKRFDEAFDGTPDSVDVSWVTPNPNDNLVVHFVPDRDHSYLKVRWPQVIINLRAGGHTYTGDRPLSGTEVYQTREGERFPYASYAATVFHEALHICTHISRRTSSINSMAEGRRPVSLPRSTPFDAS